MGTIKYRSSGQDVHLLQQILVKLGYNTKVTGYFGKITAAAVEDFQRKNQLVIDGIVGPKTWAKLNQKENYLVALNDKMLSEQDLIDFARGYNLELAAVKAVNQVESHGSGFLIDGRPKILFEGHVFWRQLVERNIQPANYVNNETKNVLYQKWTRRFYEGGAGEYNRLEKAATITSDPKFREAAYCSASWGAFQIMGYHFKSLGYPSIDDFVSKMYESEREHLNAFGKFLDVNHLIRFLQSKNWASFARAYNGPSYATNKYDVKLQNAYKRYMNT